LQRHITTNLTPNPYRKDDNDRIAYIQFLFESHADAYGYVREVPIVPIHPKPYCKSSLKHKFDHWIIPALHDQNHQKLRGVRIECDIQ
jgi:hypothetical protein